MLGALRLTALSCALVTFTGCGSSSSDTASASATGGAGTGGAAGTSSGGAAGAGGGAAGAGGGATAGAAGSGGGAAGSGGMACLPGGSVAQRLSVAGPEIHDPAGKNLVLRGWNWGEWGYEQPQDGADNAAQGANVVRIPLRWWGVYESQAPGTPAEKKVDSRSDGDPGHIEPAHLKELDAMVLQAACAGLWVDLFVDSNCGQASAANGPASYCGAVANGDAKNFSNDPASANLFAEVWEFLVDHYKTQPFIGMYELLPEPQMGCTKKPCDWTAAPAFYTPLIDRVRKLDALTPLMVGADGGYDVAHIDTAYVDRPGLIYTGDFLSFGSSHPEWVAQYVSAFRSAKQAPVFIQQVGVKHTDPDAMNRVTTILGALDDASIGWTWWTYREKVGTGQGFAPYWIDKTTGMWASDPQWLGLITAKLK